MTIRYLLGRQIHRNLQQIDLLNLPITGKMELYQHNQTFREITNNYKHIRKFKITTSPTCIQLGSF